MTAELNRWAGRSGLTSARVERERARALAHVVHETRLAGRKVDAAAGLARARTAAFRGD